MARPPRADTRSGWWVTAAQVGQFATAGLIALLIVGLATAEASRRVGEREAITNARTTTVLKARDQVEPLLTDALLTSGSDPAALARLRSIVTTSVLDDSLVRVKLWTRSGRIVFSDEARLVGDTFTLGADEVEAIDTGRIEAEVSDLAKPENRFERDQGKLLEVYLPIETPSGQPLLFEAYYRYDVVASAGSRLWRSFAPISLGALVMLELVQIPLAWSLARRLRQRQQEREALLQRALQSSEVERRQIAGDLHDGVVQDLAGVSFMLAAAADESGAPLSPDDLDTAATTLRDSIRALRTLVVDLAPPRLAEEGLASAVDDLLARVRDGGLATTLDADGLRDPIPDPLASLLYRSAQEGLRNVTRHAGARAVTVRLATQDRAAVVEVRDDGAGFDVSTRAALVTEGHLGLSVLDGMVGDAGGTLDITSVVGTGTTLRVEVPLP